MGSSNKASSSASSSSPVSSAKGHCGTTGSSTFNVTCINDCRACFSKKAAGTRLVAGTVNGFRPIMA
ncbi:MAG: hypothetical protein ACK56I_27720, partial [bacterium]